jgi:(4-O-methyl)-D-glucuronate---lignin esterase
MVRRVAVIPLTLIAAVVALSAQQQQERSTNLGTDPNGNPIRLALKTGHVSNYDEAKVGKYTLPDPLVMSDGKPVENADMWQRRRRPEIIKLYERSIFGAIPANAPKVTWQVGETDRSAHGGRAVRKTIVGRMGTAADAPSMNLTLYTPIESSKPVPVILLVNFTGGAPPAGDPPVAADIIARGWGYATVVYTDIQPDKIDTFDKGVIGVTLAGGEKAPADGEWAAIGAWSWGVMRILDYLSTDSAVDAKHIALFGHSRLGKTALWASALDERIAAVYASCSGEMGAALARRDFGETVDDMAQNFPYWFTSGFQNYVGRWADMPADAHMLIALSAPRPVFITGGTEDQWADPVGEFKAEVAAGPVYKLLGKKDLGVTELPPLDKPVIDGDLGWHYHTGGHAATEADWKAFLQFLGKYFQ